VRVIAGTLKGRRLQAPDGIQVRPTSDRLRETLFEILGYRVDAARVLDACAGTGALGIEALSRGAAEVVFVEADLEAATLITSNLNHCHIESQAAVVVDTLPDAVDNVELTDLFDLILLDPPYDDPEIGEILSAIASRLRRGGVLVFERSSRVPSFDVPPLVVVRTVRAGDSALDFYHDSTEFSPAMEVKE
jgi:16S rRNA (guanine966-N2)-methyltransferase